jgi:hypothetical protein
MHPTILVYTACDVYTNLEQMSAKEAMDINVRAMASH